MATKLDHQIKHRMGTSGPRNPAIHQLRIQHHAATNRSKKRRTKTTGTKEYHPLHEKHISQHIDQKNHQPRSNRAPPTPMNSVTGTRRTLYSWKQQEFMQSVSPEEMNTPCRALKQLKHQKSDHLP
ncbi:hypothetical protein Dimus_012169 [Dionaea muscipula]